MVTETYVIKYQIGSQTITARHTDMTAADTLLADLRSGKRGRLIVAWIEALPVA